MTDSIYNNAGMPSGRNPHNYEASFTIEQHRDELINRLGTAIRLIAALTLERDTLKAEVKEWKHSLESVALMAGMKASESWGTLDILTHVREMREANAALKAKVERLSAPGSDVVKAISKMIRAYAVEGGEPNYKEYPADTCEELLVRIGVLIAARASTPPPHPINEDEQRRKDAGWNDRVKARCVCGEVIAWYSGEYLHVAGRSKSCADGRLASPAHFLVGMPPAEPEWKRGKP